jgi:hypothetical protein
MLLNIVARSAIAGLAIGGLAVGGSAGCGRTFRAEAVQPNPMTMPTETLRSSETVTIVTGDMELEAPEMPEATKQATPIRNRRYPLVNQASFTIVSRDRLRFHVQIDHKWEEWADLKTWDVYLEDDLGHRWEPESVEHASIKLMNTFWDREQRTSICNSQGRDPMGRCFTTVGVQNDGWKNRQTLGTLSVFRGNADFVFYQRNIMHADVQKLRLVVKRTGEAFEFSWKFHDRVARE